NKSHGFEIFEAKNSMCCQAELKRSKCHSKMEVGIVRAHQGTDLCDEQAYPHNGWGDAEAHAA
ncbi:hypothetical protein HAX54_005234, partial [Datura stramonium]|nr:hypothetical protein [Datura stramonium]